MLSPIAEDTFDMWEAWIKSADPLITEKLEMEVRRFRDVLLIEVDVSEGTHRKLKEAVIATLVLAKSLQKNADVDVFRRGAADRLHAAKDACDMDGLSGQAKALFT